MSTNLNKTKVLRRLEAIREGLLRLADAVEEQSPASGTIRPGSAGSTGTGDSVDGAPFLADRATTESLADLIAERREQVEHAMDRLGAGSYGCCEDCGAGIPAGRLEFQPEATRCVQCQQRRDRRKKLAS